MRGHGWKRTKLPSDLVLCTVYWITRTFKLLWGKWMLRENPCPDWFLSFTRGNGGRWFVTLFDCGLTVGRLYLWRVQVYPYTEGTSTFGTSCRRRSCLIPLQTEWDTEWRQEQRVNHVFVSSVLPTIDYPSWMHEGCLLWHCLFTECTKLESFTTKII